PSTRNRLHGGRRPGSRILRFREYSAVRGPTIPSRLTPRLSYLALQQREANGEQHGRPQEPRRQAHRPRARVDGMQPLFHGAEGDDAGRGRPDDRRVVEHPARRGCRPRPRGGGREPLAGYFRGALRGRFQSGFETCFFSVSVRPPGGTSFTMVAPAPMVAPFPTVTGATSCTSEPMCTSSSITVRCLLAPS